MAPYTKVNLKADVDDQAPHFGLEGKLEARMARVPLELEYSGISYQRLEPNFRLPFGHTHKTQEEVYVLISGGARAKLGDEIVDLRPFDALRVHKDTLVGTLDYSDFRVATGTLGFKHQRLDAAAVAASLAAPSYLLKIIPHVDGTPQICELVRYCLSDITVKGAWSGPGALDLHAHALAPVAALPVLEVISAVHILADLTLPLGTVVHDYLA